MNTQPPTHPVQPIADEKLYLALTHIRKPIYRLLISLVVEVLSVVDFFTHGDTRAAQ